MEVVYYHQNSNDHLCHIETDIIFVREMNITFFKRAVFSMDNEEDPDEIGKEACTFYDNDNCFSYGFQRSRSLSEGLKKVGGGYDADYTTTVGPIHFEYDSNKLQELIEQACECEKSKFKKGIEKLFDNAEDSLRI